MTPKNPYWTAGTLEGKAYIERDADVRLRKELAENQRFVFIYGPRHSGTSSLVTHCMDSLSPGKYCCSRVDLSKLPQSDYQTMVGALLERIANDTALDKQEILTDFPEDTILAWLGTFPQRLILFLDEVQSLGSLPFKDQIFGKLRFLYNVRVENDQYTRLQVVMSGSVHPERLIPTNLATPFQGGIITMPLLTVKQVEKLTWDLESAQVQIEAGVASFLHSQTAGVSHLCQSILYELWEHAQRTRLNIGVADVERVIDFLVSSAAENPHFTAIYKAITEDPIRLGGFLRFVKGDSVDDAILQDLALTGLSDPDRPYLSPIYERVFGPNGPLDLGLARSRHSQITHKVNADKIAADMLPSQTTPQVHIEPPREARREHSLLTKLPTAPYAIIDASGMPDLPEMAGLAPLPGVVVMEASSEESAPYLPPAPVGPGMGGGSTQTPTATRLTEETTPGVMQVEALPEPPPAPSPAGEAQALPEPPLPPAPELSLSAELQVPPEPPSIALASSEVQALPEPPPVAPTSSEVQALPEPPPPAPAAESGEVVEIEQEEEPTWVEDPVKQMSNQLAAAKAAADKPRPSSEDPRQAEVRAKLADKLMLSAELDSFCSSFFPHVAQKFVPGMSRAEKTELLLGLVASTEISKRLREWSSRLELHQEVVSSVVSRASTTPSGGEAAAAPKSGKSSKSPTQKPETAAAPPAPVEDSASFRPPLSSLQVGVGLVLANRYFLTSEVGQGPVAIVWSAYDRIKDEQVALKLIYGPIAENPAVLEVFWRSAQQMAALSHPAIVGVLNKPREENEIHYVVMEFLPGGNLRQWVQGGKLNRGQILRVLQRLGAGLQYAHERRVIHRNIKPTNILFDGTGHARLTDFNIVWPTEVAGTGESRTDRLIYMAPEEQIGGGSGDPRSDVYSLGMCALYAFYGQELPSRVVQDRSTFIDGLDASAAVKAVLRRATAASPAERFASAAEFCRALEFDSPALPGISLRNSLPVGQSVKPERSNPSEISASLPQHTSRPAPSLPMTPHSSPPPPIPNAPSSSSAPRLSDLVPPTPAPPMVIPQLHPPELLIPQGQPSFDGRLGRRDPDSGEIPPMPGRNPQAVAEYAIDTERLRAMAAAGSVASGPMAVPMAPARRRRWQPFAFAGIALLALAGGGLGYLWGTQRATPVVTDNSGAGGNSAGDNAGQQMAINRPLRVEPLVQQPPEVPPPPPVAEKTPPVAEKTPPVAEKAKKPAAPTMVAANQTAAKGAPAAGPATLAKGPGPAAAPAKGSVAGTPAKPTAVATTQLPVQKPVPPVTAPAKPTPAQKPTAVATAPQPPAKPTVLAMATPPKAKSEPAPKAAPPTVRPAEVSHPKAAAPPPRPKAPPPHPAAPPPRPAGVSPAQIGRPAASGASTAEGEAMLQQAQQAFVRGQHQQAIAMAMQVTTRGGGDSLKAWRFVGGAACSVRSAQLATNAYNHLRDPDHRRLLVDLCRRNGLLFNGTSFISED